MEIDFSHSQVKVLDERDTRKKLINFARQYGFEQDLIKILNKYDTLLRNCTNEKERKDIGKLGSYEIFCLFGKGGDFYVDGELVAKENK